MKQKIALGACLMAVGLIVSAPAPAQPVPPAYPGAGAVLPPSYPGAGPALPPHEVLAIVRSTGLEPLSRPQRQGPTYGLRVIDPAGQEMRVVVDARLGRILRVAPVPRYAVLPPFYSRPPGQIALVPDGYGPSSRLPALPPDIDGAPINGPGAAGLPTGPGRAPAASVPPHAATPAGPPPLPRPRPKIASVDSSAVQPTAAQPAPSAPQIAQPPTAAGETITNSVVAAPMPPAGTPPDQAE